MDVWIKSIYTVLADLVSLQFCFWKLEFLDWIRGHPKKHVAFFGMG